MGWHGLFPDDIPILDIDGETDLAATKVSRADNDVLAKPDEKVKHKKGADKKERDKKGKKRDRNPNVERGTNEEKTSLLLPHTAFEHSGGKQQHQIGILSLDNWLSDLMVYGIILEGFFLSAFDIGNLLCMGVGLGV